MGIYRILLLDDHALVRAGLRNALASLPALEVVGEVGSSAALEAALADLRPDLLVMDVAMPDFDPLATVAHIKHTYPALKILVVSAHDDDAYVIGLLEAGVQGYHLKDQPLADLQLAVQRVLAGDRWISGPLVGRLVRQRPSAPSYRPPALTRRQRELLRLLGEGRDNRAIAQAMELSVKTVENHLTRLYRALDVESRLEALTYVMRHPDVLAAPAGELATPAQSPQGEPEAAPGATLTILLVDDNARYRQLLGRMIGKVSPDALLYEADDSAEATRLATRAQPHLALIDVVLHDEDGILCARRVKAASPATRIVLISAYPDREFHRLGLEAGALAFVDKKDLDAAAVRHLVEDALK